MRLCSGIAAALAFATFAELATPAAAAALMRPVSPVTTSAAAVGPSILGTVPVPIRADRFADDLRRAREDASGSPALQQLIAPARGLSPLRQLSYVQRAVTNRIRWTSSATAWGQHNYWASAAQTLALGAGDMGNRAIVKLQALHALGFNTSDLFLTLARDRVGGPITVVSVRLGGRYYVLDDTGGVPFVAEQRQYEFQPQLSFGWTGAWVHMARTAAIAGRAATTALIGN